MSDSAVYLAIIIPLLAIILISLLFYRIFTKNISKDYNEIQKNKNFDELYKKAVFREARIISVIAEKQLHSIPSNRFLNMKFEIKDDSGDYKIYSSRWLADTYYVSQLQPDSTIQVKIYDEYVFPVTDGARIYPE